ncbi:MAG: Coenzyme F420 hydrogenase/dehydrogenase, beta subunit C-terminal domain, partial [Oscillospiraceae bacterium]|nr:Coenzyme F420 hydrogenase/dehydrogenase, beta subunit C-terminal domain [Oscillospiraceae bacterium]
SKYLWELEDYFKGKITRVWFKNKEHSWNNFSTRVDFDKKISFEGNDEYYIRNRYTDNFYKGFLKYHLFSRSSCYDCNFKGHNRTADLTLADAWGITLRFNGADNKHGISTAIVNSDKGKILLDKTSENFIMEEHTLAEVKKGNLNFDNCVKKGQYSEYFYEQLRAGKRFSSIITNITNLTAKEKSGVPITTPTIIIPKNNSWDDLIAQKKIIIYGKNGINIDPNAKLNIGGRLSINVDVVGEADNCCQILVQKGATLEVRGNFKLYFNNYIKVFPGAKLTLGSGYINRNGSITCSNSISIGDGCVIAPYVKILDSDFHTIMDENGVRINPPAPVVIEDHCWIGYDVTIMKGVTIGTGSVIGAGSVVNKSIPPHSLAVGVPAKVVKENITWK